MKFEDQQNCAIRMSNGNVDNIDSPVVPVDITVETPVKIKPINEVRFGNIVRYEGDIFILTEEQSEAWVELVRFSDGMKFNLYLDEKVEDLGPSSNLKF